MNILEKIKEKKLRGFGGASFPVDIKWEAVKNAKGEKKYVICNASEGEPDVKKDKYILENYLAELVAGMMLAIKFLGAEKGYIYLNPKYYSKLAPKLKKAIGKNPIEVFKKSETAGYVGGEESSVLNGIEGKRIEPRQRPPFPTEHGLFGCPTLVNNVETFYNIYLISEDKYQGKKFYTIGGDCSKPGVYEFDSSLSLEDILKQSNNYPEFNFFVQSGGGASGEILLKNELNNPASGASCLLIHKFSKDEAQKLLIKISEFYKKQSCGQCAPCREGTYRISEILKSAKPDFDLLNDILFALKESSFCGLGASAPAGIGGIINKILKIQDK